ncbi:MAG: hypothetical protein P8166_17170, partial [Candidatus Thiodiazotropha sp.]
SSTLSDAREVFQMHGKANLFIDPDGKPVLEAYFERVFLSGLRADFVLVLDVGEQLATELYDHGSRTSLTSKTTRMVELSSDDQTLISNQPIRLINYIPYANLDEELVSSRFGNPEQKIMEPETGITHWIYPDRGTSLGLNPNGKELIQYMPPGEIPALIKHIQDNNRSYEEAQKRES